MSDPAEMRMFDLGLSKGREIEQERIIKLLEQQKKIFSSPQYSTTGGYAEQFALNQAIALIKGEN